MRLLAFGAAVAIAGGGGYYAVGRNAFDIDRTVAKPPADVYDAFHLMLGDSSGGMQGLAGFDEPAMEHGNPADAVKVSIKDELNRAIDYTLLQASKPLIHINVRFEPLEGGAKTNLRAKIEIGELPGMAGHGGAPIRGLGAIGFKFIVSRLMDELVRSIEKGDLGAISQKLAEARASMDSDPRVAQLRSSAMQARASAPMLDPEMERMHPEGTSPTPTLDVAR